MRIIDIRECSIPISRYADPLVAPAQLSTSVVAVVTDASKNGDQLIGYGFASIGRYAQSGLIRDRFAPRLLGANPGDLMRHDQACIDPLKAWTVMMSGEKPGGHGERCVAVGALDMAIWDVAAKAVDQPLHQFLSDTFNCTISDVDVPVYAGGGYYFPNNDHTRLKDEAEYFAELGFRSVKIKIGSAALADDVRRVETVLAVVGKGELLAVDAMNSYTPALAVEAAHALQPYQLRWFEDICDPLDYETHRAVVEVYAPPISAGEALFSLADARNLLRYSGLRAGHDVLTFDPTHCYGLPEYWRIIKLFENDGWSRRDFQPHGGHLFSLHVAAGLGLGGCECNPHNFQPFGGFSDGQKIAAGITRPPDAPGIGFETRASLIDLFRRSLDP